MDRRKLITGAALGAAGLALGACGGQTTAAGPAAPNINRGRKQFTMVTTWPKNLPGLGEAAERTAQRIAELSDGMMTVKVFAAGELVPALEAFDAVAGGTADMYHGAEYYWQGKNPAFNFFTAVPMGMTAQELMGWVEFGGGQALWEELSAQFGVIAFQAANTGHQMGGWFRREIGSLEDFKGLKMRIPGLGGAVIRELGGTSETLPGGEIYQALQTGQIDATEWVGPWNDLSLGFYREAPFYYGPGFHEPGSALSLGMNRAKWDSLDMTEQTIIRTACGEVNNRSLGEFTYFNGVALKSLVEEHGVQLRTFPDDVMDRVGAISKDIRAQAGAFDPLAGRIYESFETALKTMSGWAKVSDGPYLAARARQG
jgi:TRAP-type mannitol/chloroaromatic compound transport system substrate-binding protein